MIKAFSDEAWEDYTYWETQDKRTLRRILKLIDDAQRNGVVEREAPASLSGGSMSPHSW